MDWANCGLHPLIHTFLEFTLVQDAEERKAEPRTQHFLSLKQDIVAWAQMQKCGLKYVIYSSSLTGALKKRSRSSAWYLEGGKCSARRQSPRRCTVAPVSLNEACSALSAAGFFQFCLISERIKAPVFVAGKVSSRLLVVAASHRSLLR